MAPLGHDFSHAVYVLYHGNTNIMIALVLNAVRPPNYLPILSNYLLAMLMSSLEPLEIQNLSFSRAVRATDPSVRSVATAESGSSLL